ncbi:flagellar hook-associated protein FlgK [Legionella sp. W05-934-2]|uniref:flagellar hook-associated protein FlgK n=1 Tax=Legionella sp. W05-934-2 TaxID=1198649 RepID=UPI0034629102
MTDMLSIAVSGLNAFQRGLDISSNNVMNAHTPGYSRQSVILSGSKPQLVAGSFIGTGVSFDGVYRNSDRFADMQVRQTLTAMSQYDAFYQQALQIDKLLSGDGTSVSASMQDFFNTISQLNENPDSISSRNVMLKQSELLVNQFNRMQQQLDDQVRGNQTQIELTANQINSISSRIVEINKQLRLSPNSPDLLDKRDELLKELSQYTSVSTTETDTGAVNVFIGKGQGLVVGSTRQVLEIQPSPAGEVGTQIFLNNGSGSINITESITTGKLGGLLEYESNILDKANLLLGQMAIGMAMAFNQQHHLGVDLNDNLGGDFFTDFNDPTLQLNRSIAAPTNAGTGVLSVEITDIGQTKLSDYQLVVSDTATNEVRVIRQSDGQSFTLNWTDTPPAPPAGQVVIDGLRITFDDVGNLVDNDSYSLTPLRDAAGQLGLEVNDPSQIALAAAVRTESPLSNTGTGKINLGTVLNTTEVQKDYRIEFLGPNQYQIVNVTDAVTTGPFAYTPNQDNEIFIPDGVTPSYSVIISGAPDTGDVFNMTYNSGSAGDNRNGLMLNDIQGSKLFESGSATLFDKYAGLVADVGGSTYSAQLRFESADILHKQAVDYRESISGVNLDEEAANILRFQQAYQAAGQLLRISSEILNVLYQAF